MGDDAESVKEQLVKVETSIPYLDKQSEMRYENLSNQITAQGEILNNRFSSLESKLEGLTEEIKNLATNVANISGQLKILIPITVVTGSSILLLIAATVIMRFLGIEP